MYGPSDREIRSILLLYVGIAVALLALAFGAGVALGYLVWGD